MRKILPFKFDIPIMMNYIMTHYADLIDNIERAKALLLITLISA